MKKEDTQARLFTAEAGNEDDSSQEFEFAFAERDVPDSLLADDAFEDGRLYPLFDRKLLGDSGKDKGNPLSGTSSWMDDLDAVAAGKYCAWTPRSVPSSPERCKKSSSTGSLSSRRWRLRDLVGGRSHSDGKEKFVFLAQEKKSSNVGTKPVAVEERSKVKEKGKGRKVTEVSLASLHSLYYDKASASGGGGSGGRPSSLPYKQDLIGILGLGRAHPFH